MIENPDINKLWGFAYPLGIADTKDIPLFGQIEVRKDLFNHLALVSPMALVQRDLESIAVSIMMEANVSFENEQGSFPNSQIPGLAASSFSEEDLPSDLIGFAAGIEAFRQGRSDVSESELLEFVGQTCGRIFNKYQSLRVWDKVYENGAKLKYGRDDGWKYFYPRILDLNCVHFIPTCSKPRGYPGYMSDLINSYIPSDGFKTEDYNRNGTWWWTWHDALVWAHHPFSNNLHVPASSWIPSYLHFD
jgi:hypothetical protein